MSVETPPENQSDSASDLSSKATEHLDSVNQLSQTLESFVRQFADLIIRKNWVSLLLFIDAILIVVSFSLGLPKKYPIFFWCVVIGIFLIALVIAVRKIQRQPSPIPDFTERKAIKGLRAFTKEDAEIFTRLERERDLRECLESITSDTFRLGILMGESGTGKTSFLQAGIIPQLAKEESSHRGVYIRFTNQEPLETICRALSEELQLSLTENSDRDLLQILSSAVDATDKQLILIFDQFEQFFVHFKQKVDREPFINALKDWYCADNPLPIEILISIRGDLADRLIELQKVLGYSLSPYEVFRLEKFSPESATKVLQVIAQAEAIPFDEKFMLELSTEKLASREDGLISPVDLQVLAKTIERQQNELQAFNRPAFHKIGGIEGLMTRFLKTTLDARVIPRQREAAIKVLLAVTDLERNLRAGALTLEEIQQKTQGTLTPGEIVDAAAWLGSGEVRLISTIEQDRDIRYELAHERLIPALREEARRELTSADEANELLDRRVNEWLGNQKSQRYLFNWQELRLFKQQKPYLIWGANKTHKENLLKRSWKKLTRQLIAIGMVLVLGFVGIGWWHTPWGQIQQVRWELKRLSKRVNDKYKGEAALAFVKDKRHKQANAIIEQIDNSYSKAEVLDNSYSKAEVLTEIAQTYGTINNSSQAEKLLLQALAAAEQIDNSDDKARVLTEIAQTIGTINNFSQAEKLLLQTLAAAEQIYDSYYKTWVLTEIAQTYGTINNSSQAEKLLLPALAAAEQINNSDNKARVLIVITHTQAKFSYWRQAHHTVSECPTDQCKVESLAHILSAWAEKKNPALADKEED